MAKQVELPTPPTLTQENFGTFWQPGHDNFAQGLPKSDRLQILGWFDACPQPHALAEFYGINWIINRYAECNLVGGYILDQAEKLNPALAAQLSKSTPRPNGEYPKVFDPQSVPDTYKKTLSPGQTPVGYASSRVLIEQYGRDPQWQIGDRRVSKGNKILELSLVTSSNPADFLATLANLVTKADANPVAVLGHIFAAEFEEEGGLSLVRQLAVAVQAKSPHLWQTYLSIKSFEEQQKAGIIPSDVLLNK